MFFIKDNERQEDIHVERLLKVQMNQLQILRLKLAKENES